MEYSPHSRAFVRKILDENGLFLNKKRGQNYLCDQNVVEKILSFCDEKLPVFEVGIGLGALTSELSEKYPTIGIEIDKGIFQLTSSLLQNENLSLFNEDFLKMDLGSLPQKKYQFISNLPYSISGEAIRRFIESKKFDFGIVMLQKEFVDRMLSKPKEKSYGLLAVLSQSYLKIDRLFTVSARCFFPEPTVDSEVVRISKTGCDLPQEDFKNFLTAAFAMKRKTINNNFKKADFPLSILDSVGIEPSARPEELGVETWQKLFSIFSTNF